MCRRCAGCETNLDVLRESGISGVYAPGENFELCMTCWRAEEDEIEEHGNNLPHLLKRYRANTDSPPSPWLVIGSGMEF